MFRHARSLFHPTAYIPLVPMALCAGGVFTLVVRRRLPRLATFESCLLSGAWVWATGSLIATASGRAATAGLYDGFPLYNKTYDDVVIVAIACVIVHIGLLRLRHGFSWREATLSYTCTALITFAIIGFALSSAVAPAIFMADSPLLRNAADN